ncbi:MAG: hydroxymethylglutaryl-CoA synthase [Proteobacteria bacterium]|nr:hydroxymethylglutaryl-CoA synthase [Pseudomonadota bacterium]
MSVGIQRISFYTAPFYLDMSEFAQARGEERDKFHIGIGQDQMSVISPDEDIVTLAANAALPIMQEFDPKTITAVLFATESGIDQSKSAGAFVHGLLGLSSRCRVVELKHACYGGTAALQMAVNMVRVNTSERVLVIAADVARYELGSPGEATQGCGAVAMLISNQADILAIEAGSGYYTEDVMDFWRPNYRDTALVDGKYSTMVYLTALKYAWQYFQEARHLAYNDFARFCYHLPFTKMAIKAHSRLMKLTEQEANEATIEQAMGSSLRYNRTVGNSYSASLYFGLISLLENDAENLAGQRIGLFSYGSGCVGEFFSGIVADRYRDYLYTTKHQTLLAARQQLTFSAYLAFYKQFGEVERNDNIEIAHYTNGHFRLSAIRAHKRQYVQQSS